MNQHIDFEIVDYIARGIAKGCYRWVAKDFDY